MCELSFIALTDNSVNAAVAYALAFIDGVRNQDGVGFYFCNKLWKSPMTASTITNLFGIIDSHSEGESEYSPIILHTRFATAGIGGVKSVTREGAHPYETDRYVLAHNGTLKPKVVLSEEEKKAIGSMTDSEYFLQELTKEPSTDILTALNEAMKKFTGKFAFLIFDKTERRYYAVRGWSATLFKIPVRVNGESVGYVVNTEKADLIASMILGTNICHAYLGTKLEWSSTEIVELERESLYELGEYEVTRLGKVTENFPSTVAVQTTQTATGATASGSTTTGVTGTTSKKGNFVLFATRFRISISEIDVLCNCLFGHGMLGISAQERRALDVLTPYFEKRLENGKLLSTWREIKYKGDFILDQYTSGKIQFPFFMNTPEELLKLKGNDASNQLALPPTVQ
jgi:predicted glutamine amidotransferase